MPYSLEKRDLGSHDELEAVLYEILLSLRDRKFVAASISEERDTPIFDTDDSSQHFTEGFHGGEIVKLRVVTLPRDPKLYLWPFPDAFIDESGKIVHKPKDA